MKHRIYLEMNQRLKHVLSHRLWSSFQLYLVYTGHNVQQYSCRQFPGKDDLMEVKVDLKKLMNKVVKRGETDLHAVSKWTYVTQP